MITTQQAEQALAALDAFTIELPSWGFANTGTRFGKFIQASAATTTAEKIADAGAVHGNASVCDYSDPSGVVFVPRDEERIDGV